jgi:predicted nucleotidyltransferase
MKTTIQKISKYPKIIKIFLDFPNRNFTSLEISKETKISYSTCWRYVRDLNRAGIIHIEKIGEYNVCRLNKDSPLIGQLQKFLSLQLSPHILAVKEFVKHIKGMGYIKKVILFGSVAEGKEKLESDIDIVVFVDKKDKKIEDKITNITDKILEKSRMKIIPLLLTESELKENKQFADEIKKGVILYERSKRS